MHSTEAIYTIEIQFHARVYDDSYTFLRKKAFKTFRAKITKKKPVVKRKYLCYWRTVCWKLRNEFKLITSFIKNLSENNQPMVVWTHVKSYSLSYFILSLVMGFRFDINEDIYVEVLFLKLCGYYKNTRMTLYFYNVN